MKNVILSGLALALLTACQPPAAGGSKELNDRVETLEKKVAALEKRPAGDPRAQQKQPEPQTAAYNIPVGSSAYMGKKDAPVSVVLFSDFQCPFCARVDPLLHEIVKDEALKDKVNVVFKHFPLSFHKEAGPASKAAMAAKEQGEEYFWKMGEKLLANQRALTSENFSVWAKEIGLDVKKFEADLKNNDAKYQKEIDADIALGQSAAKVRGTPSLFVGGWELRQRSVDGVKELIKEKKLTSL